MYNLKAAGLSKSVIQIVEKYSPKKNGLSSFSGGGKLNHDGQPR